MGDWRQAELDAIVQRLGIHGDTAEPKRLRLTTSDRVPLHALDWGGDGETALLLHGGALTCRTWDYVCTALRKGYRLVALDLRGHGDSGWSDDYAMPRFGRDGIEVIESLGRGSVHLVGMSLGGVAAVETAALRGDLVRTLAIVDVAPGVIFDGSANMRGFITGMIGAPSLEAVVEAALRASPGSDPQRVRYRMQAMLRRNDDGVWVWKRDARRFIDFPHILQRVEAMAERLSGFSQPLLVCRGGRSKSLPKDAAVRFAGRVANGRLVEIEDAGHNIQEDNPVALAHALDEFWRGIAPT